MNHSRALQAYRLLEEELEALDEERDHDKLEMVHDVMDAIWLRLLTEEEHEWLNARTDEPCECREPKWEGEGRSSGGPCGPVCKFRVGHEGSHSWEHAGGS